MRIDEGQIFECSQCVVVGMQEGTIWEAGIKFRESRPEYLVSRKRRTRFGSKRELCRSCFTLILMLSHSVYEGDRIAWCCGTAHQQVNEPITLNLQRKHTSNRT